MRITTGDKSAIKLCGIAILSIFLTGLVSHGAARFIHLEASSVPAKLLHSLCFGLYFVAIVKLLQSRHDFAPSIVTGISVVGYIVTLGFVLWSFFWAFFGVPAS